MPILANITVKKADNTTDIVWTAKSPSSGDKVPAILRSDTVGAAVAFRPEIRLWSYDASKGAQRALKATVVWPHTVTESGVVKVVGYSSFSGEFKIFNTAADIEVGEFAAQVPNLIATALVKQCIKEGFSLT